MDNSIKTGKESQSSALSSAATTTDVNATCSATAKAGSQIAIGPGSKNELTATCVTEAMVDVIKTYTATQTLTNSMLSDISQENTTEVSGGMFQANSDTDNSINSTSAVGQAISSYSYMNTTMDASAYANVDVGAQIAIDGGENKATATAVVEAVLDVQDTAVVDASGANWMTDSISQANTLDAKSLLGKVAEEAANALTMIVMLVALGGLMFVGLKYAIFQDALSAVFGGGEDAADANTPEGRKARAWKGFVAWYVMGIGLLLLVYFLVVEGLTVSWPSTQVLDSILAIPPNFKKAFKIKWVAWELWGPHPVPTWVTVAVVGALLTLSHYKYGSYKRLEDTEDQLARRTMMQQATSSASQAAAGVQRVGQQAAAGIQRVGQQAQRVGQQAAAAVAKRMRPAFTTRKTS